MTVNELTTYLITVEFTDEDDNAVIPASLTYRIDDVASGQEILDNTVVYPSEATYDLIVESENNTILNEALFTEQRRVTVIAAYGDGRTVTGEHYYLVKNLHTIGNPVIS